MEKGKGIAEQHRVCTNQDGKAEKLWMSRRSSYPGLLSLLINSEYSSRRNWSALPQDLLMLLVQKLSPMDVAALAQVCSPWYRSLREKAFASDVEPMIVMWNKKGGMILYQSGRGWSPMIHSCISWPPIVSHGPWLISWKHTFKKIHYCNLITGYAEAHSLPPNPFSIHFGDWMVKAGIVASTAADEVPRLLCIRFGYVDQVLQSSAFFVEESRILRQCGPAQMCSSQVPFHISDKKPSPEIDNMIVFYDKKCAYFTVPVFDGLLGEYCSGTKSLILWHKWESNTWGCKGMIGGDYYKLFGQELVFRRQLVNLNGKLAFGRFNHDNNIEICFLSDDAEDKVVQQLSWLRDVEVACAPPDIAQRTVMPCAMWSKFHHIVMQVRKKLEKRCQHQHHCACLHHPIVINAHQCDHLFIHMFCTIKSLLACIIVYDGQQDSWRIISHIPEPLFRNLKYSPLLVPPNSLLAKAALSSKRMSRLEKFLLQSFPNEESMDVSPTKILITQLSE